MESLPIYHCGHQVDNSPRENLAQDCFDCRNMAAQVEGALLGLPSLSGTKAQNAWAETIRLSKLREIEKYVRGWDALPKSKREVMKKPAQEALKALGCRLSRQTRLEINEIADEEWATEAAAVCGIPEKL